MSTLKHKINPLGTKMSPQVQKIKKRDDASYQEAVKSITVLAELSIAVAKIFDRFATTV